MAWTEQDYQEIVARLMANSIGVNEVPNADKADDVTSLPAFKPSGSNSETSVVNYPLEFLKGEQGEPGIQGEPGKSFKVAGEYATLEALKSAVPDGSAVDGFMAVGTEAPYEYYAWVNGEWISQGKIGGMDEAPTDGKAYGRKNGNWAEVSDKKYVDDSISSARSVGYMMQLTEIDASGLDENTWYPVVMGLGNIHTVRMEVMTVTWQSGVPSWATHKDGFSVRKIWEANGFSWGANLSVNRQIFVSEYRWADTDPIRGVGQMTNSGNEYVFVRGGGKYQFHTSHGIVPELKTERFEANEQSIEPTTETPAEIVANIATKGYADNIGYGKVIDVPDGSYFTRNANRTGTEAIELINNIFGSIEKIKEVILDIIEHHTRYLFHSYASNTNCIELSSVYAYYNVTKGEYNLQYNISYYTHGGPASKRMGFKLMPNDEECVASIEDILVSDNLTTLTKKTAAEYEAIGSKDEGTMYAITD